MWLQPAPDIMFSFVSAHYDSDHDQFLATGSAEVMKVWDFDTHQIVVVESPSVAFRLEVPIDASGTATPTLGALRIYDPTNANTLITADLKSFSFYEEADSDFVFEFSITGGSMVPGTFSAGPAWLLMHNLGDPADAFDPGLGFPGNFTESFSNISVVDTNADFGIRGVPEPATLGLLAAGLGLFWCAKAYRTHRG